MTAGPVVGVDVAKDRLDVAVRPSGEVWSEVNDEAEITALVARLRPLGPTRRPPARRSACARASRAQAARRAAIRKPVCDVGGQAQGPVELH